MRLGGWDCAVINVELLTLVWGTPVLLGVRLCKASAPSRPHSGCAGGRPSRAAGTDSRERTRLSLDSRDEFHPGKTGNSESGVESSATEMPTHTTKDKAVTWAHGAQGVASVLPTA